METHKQKQQLIRRIEKKIERRKLLFYIASMLYVMIMILPVPILIRIWANCHPEVENIIESGYFIVAFVVVWFGAWILIMFKVVNMGVRDEKEIKQLKQELGETEEE